MNLLALPIGMTPHPKKKKKKKKKKKQHVNPSKVKINQSLKIPGIPKK